LASDLRQEEEKKPQTTVMGDDVENAKEDVCMALL
jgi:hypothetical protein